MDATWTPGALKVYVCNVMTQAGETEGYTAADHIRALFDHAWPGLFDICLTSDSPIPRSIAERYLAEGADRCCATGRPASAGGGGHQPPGGVGGK